MLRGCLVAIDAVACGDAFSESAAEFCAHYFVECAVDGVLESRCAQDVLYLGQSFVVDLDRGAPHL
jgi:hypothetical protein